MLRKDRFKMVRMGIVGTGRIAPRFVAEAKYVSGIKIICAYNPETESAKRFEKKHGIETMTESYIDFLDNVNAVYIASPNETHYAYTKTALEYGKHVLCEKLVAFTKAESEEMYELAKSKHLILLEGVKTAYCPGFQQLINIAKSGKIGQIVDVEACFSRIQQSNVREMWDEEYGGSFTEFGTYSLLPIVKLLGTNNIKSNIWTFPGKNGVDMYTKTTFDYGTQTALAKTGLAIKSEGQLVIAGTKGYILVPSPWWLTKYFEVRYEDPNKIEKYEFPFERRGLHYEVEELVRRMEGLNKVSLSEKESIWFAAKMEEYLESRKERLFKEYKVPLENSNQQVQQNAAETLDISKQDKNRIGIWAHRGCSLAYLENTLSAFHAADKLDRITGIELDVQRTKDNVLLVIHDETVDRTTNGSGIAKTIFGIG